MKECIVGTIDSNPVTSDNNGRTVVPPTSKPLHRLAAARQEKGITPRALAQRLNTTVAHIVQQEQSAADLAVSALYQWADALQMPAAELLADRFMALPSPRFDRNQGMELLRATRTILQQAEQPSVRRMAETLLAQLLEIMPELKNAGVPTARQQNGTKKEKGFTLRPLSQKVFFNSSEDRWESKRL